MNKKKDIVLVLGASSDMGGEIIRQLAQEKPIVLAHYNNSLEKINELKSVLGTDIVPLKADLSNDAEIAGLIDKIKEEYAYPSKIVHLPASKLTNIRFKDISWNKFQKDIDIQLKSSVMILRSFLPLMAKDRYGKIVFVLSSVTYNVPPKTISYYVTVKYALLGLMKALASEYAEKNININAVSPSMTQTRFLDEMPAKIADLAAEAHPLKRNAIPQDIAPLVNFLLSSKADYLTGLNIPVSGGSIF
jgi:3-oxoacyl-[acyl-carrier protein] reductase